mgnify:CR=1 FL=1
MIDEKVIVLGARVLVEEQKTSKETKSGIVLANSDNIKTNIGTVIAIGDGAILESGLKVPMQVQVGDKVMYTPFSGSPIKENRNDEEKYLILNERDILCIIRD